MIPFAALATFAVTLLIRPRHPSRDRLRALASSGPPAARSRSPGPVAPGPRVASPRWRAGVALAAAVAAVAVLGVMPGALVGIVAAAGVLATGPGDGSVHVDSDAVPLVVELVAACLAAGIPLPAALEAAGAGAADELGRRCREAAASLRAGDPAEAVFAGWRGEAALEPVARTLARVTRSGAAAADDLRRAASRLRAQSRSRALARVQRAAVMVVLPLGLCFLPAFVLVAAVPLVMGLIPNLR